MMPRKGNGASYKQGGSDTFSKSHFQNDQWIMCWQFKTLNSEYQSVIFDWYHFFENARKRVLAYEKWGAFGQSYQPSCTYNQGLFITNSKSVLVLSCTTSNSWCSPSSNSECVLVPSCVVNLVVSRQAECRTTLDKPVFCFTEYNQTFALLYLLFLSQYAVQCL